MTTAANSPARTFDAVLCDLDNVIRFYDHTELGRLERAAGLAPGATVKVAFSDGIDGPLLVGRISKAEWAESVARGLADQVPAEVARGLATALVQAPTRADEAVVELLLAAQAHLPVVLVTNASLELEEELAPLGLTGHFAHIVNSARVGIAKPDRRIYALAAERAGVTADRCLFVDDRLENVEAATALGMSGLHFRGPDDLRTALTRLLDDTAV